LICLKRMADSAQVGLVRVILVNEEMQAASLRQRDTDAHSSGSFCTWPNRSVPASGFCNARRIFL
jgi:hypothetical protein